MKRLLALLTAAGILAGMVFTTQARSPVADCTQWMAQTIPFEAGKTYADPFVAVRLDLVLTHTASGTVLTVPGFWDGGNTWRVRFALTKPGMWTYATVCSDPTDAGLHARTGTLNAVPYAGDLEIYRRGFVTVDPARPYFVYADGTPFFYLGDTHWGMASEDLDTAGDHAGDTQTDSHFRYIVEARARQGFTVYQSEPIGATYTLTDGVGEADIAGFRDLDRRFAAIAENGLVHANACFFYPSAMTSPIFSQPEYLETLTRYWVARYGAFPVLWTLGQETDKNFYGVFNTADNPYKAVCAYIHRYDPYRHPITAHQENTSRTRASDSAFRDVPGHNWYGAQWSPKLNGQLDFAVPKDYYTHADGKVTVNFEGRYDYLWTKHFGARMQGWTAFLNGMYGYGYGCADIWLYKSTYDMDTTSFDGIDTITPEDKATRWPVSLEFETAYQLGYMKAFLDEVRWWELEPRFDDRRWFSPDGFYGFVRGVYAALTKSGTLFEKLAALGEIGAARPYFSLATDDNERYVLYYYNPTRHTGMVKNLDKTAGYTLCWFNPRAGRYEGDPERINPDASGRCRLPQKPDTGDWVAVVQKDTAG